MRCCQETFLNQKKKNQSSFEKGKQERKKKWHADNDPPESGIPERTRTVAVAPISSVASSSVKRWRHARPTRAISRPIAAHPGRQAMRVTQRSRAVFDDIFLEGIGVGVK